jgi:hypothetical protein
VLDQCAEPEVEQLSFSAQGTLDVFQQRGDYLGQGLAVQRRPPGIDTPLLTSRSAAQLRVRTGGDFRLQGALRQGGWRCTSELSIDANRITPTARSRWRLDGCRRTHARGITLAAGPS